MLRLLNIKSFAWLAGVAATLVAGGMFIVSGAQAQNKEPIKIGFGQSLTGSLSPNGKQALLGAEIWRDHVNKAKGGLLGRQVKLVYYDDKSSPAEVPGIYTKLLDVDKVDLVVCRLCQQPSCARDAGGDPQGQDVRQSCSRSTSTTSLNTRNISRCCRRGRTRRPRLPRGSSTLRLSKIRSRRPSQWRSPTPSSRRTLARARVRTSRSTA